MRMKIQIMERLYKASKIASITPLEVHKRCNRPARTKKSVNQISKMLDEEAIDTIDRQLMANIPVGMENANLYLPPPFLSLR